MKKIRAKSVVIVTDEFPPHSFGGVGKVVDTQASELRRRGFQVHVIVANEHLRKIDWSQISAPPSLHIHFEEEDRIESRIKALRPSFVLIHTKRRLQKIDRRVKCLWWEHGYFYGESQKYEGYRGHIVFVSRLELQAALGDLKDLKIPTNRLHVVPNSYLKRAPVYSRDRSIRKIGFVGRAIEIKRAHFVAQVAVEENIKAILCGLYEEISSHRNLEFLGWISEQQMEKKFWSRIDLLVVPSRKESFGMAALEAMIRGIPVVGTDGGGLRDLLLVGSRKRVDRSGRLENHEAGLVFSSDYRSDETAYTNMKRQILRYYNFTRQQRKQLAGRALRQALRFNVRSSVDKILEIVGEK